MKKYIAVILTVAVIVSAMYENPTVADQVSVKDVYGECYGDQLSDNTTDISRFFYDQMIQNYIYQEDDIGNEENKWTGLAKPLENKGIFTPQNQNFTLKKLFNSKEDFNANQETWRDTEIKVLKYCIRDAFDAFVKDYPQVYWLDSMESKISLNMSSKTVADGIEGTIVIQVTMTPVEYETGMSQYISEFDAAVCQAKEDIIQKYNITAETKEENIVKAIHDYITSQVDYNHQAASSMEEEQQKYNYAHTSVSVFLKGKKWNNLIMCEGYAKAFKILCDAFQMDSALLIGESINPQQEKEAHMWNAVKVEGKWYAVDVSWDDQGDNIYYVYLLAGKKSKGYYDLYERDHVTTDQFSSYEGSKSFILPQISEIGFWQEPEHMTSQKTTEDPTENITGGTNPSDTNPSDTNQDNNPYEQEENPGQNGNHSGPSIDIKDEDGNSYVWKLTGVKNVVYTGKKVRQNLKLSCDGKILKEGTDYLVSYQNNLNVGKARFTITPIGKYQNTKPSSFSYTFNIVKASIKKASVVKIKAQKLKRGKVAKPSIKLKFHGKKLKKGKDYKISYKNNKKKGTAKIILKGKGNFKGKRTVKFKIK